MAADTPDFVSSAIQVPEHVVVRELGGQTVVLNLRTGQYHGLNQTAGALLESLRAGGSVQSAASEVAERFSALPELVQRDLVQLCGELHQRGLIEIVDGG